MTNAERDNCLPKNASSPAVLGPNIRLDHRVLFKSAAMSKEVTVPLADCLMLSAQCILANVDFAMRDSSDGRMWLSFTAKTRSTDGELVIFELVKNHTSLLETLLRSIGK